MKIYLGHPGHGACFLMDSIVQSGPLGFHFQKMKMWNSKIMLDDKLILGLGLISIPVTLVSYLFLDFQ